MPRMDYNFMKYTTTTYFQEIVIGKVQSDMVMGCCGQYLIGSLDARGTEVALICADAAVAAAAIVAAGALSSRVPT